ncbi:MAG: 16S rRNA (guanine(527)-N(7))-methyltransferase RsmG [Sulfurimonas sp.]|nr:16S rRNA (guanine(527)-N(7))-methyltransferase RsmG [Sulfurimonas sp.]
MDLKATLAADNIKLPDNFFYNIQKYKEHLFKWNKIHNLTGARDEDTLNHFIYDAVFPVSFLPKYKNLLDIGTGAGFPGMILALALPDTQVTLVEPLAKRASFLQFIKADLELDNVRVVKKRVEDMDSEIFSLITSRAVTDTKMLLKLSENFRDENSTLLFYKGEKVFDEIDEDMPHKIIQTKNRHYLLLGENL